MNKVNKFNVIVGILIVVICIIISFMAYMAAKTRNQNLDNVIYIDSGNGYNLSVPRSNLVTKYVNVKKDINSENGVLHIDVSLPRVNIDTETIEKINSEIYNKYQEIYNYALSVEGNESILCTYDYDYIDREHKLVIVIKEEKTKLGSSTKIETKYVYDVKNDKLIDEDS